ncbi:MAG: glycosyltransferase family 4 protein [Bacteroidales bacterium]|nr:glycosyltransferase family 4 protein [Bacteroidales bacterium]
MIIGFEAKRAFKNNTGLGNYSRMLICGLAQEHQEVYSYLYSPDMTGEYSRHFTSYANISTVQPSGFDRHFPRIWRSVGVSYHLNQDKVDIFHGLSHELPHGISRSIKRVVTIHDLIVWRFPRYYSLFDRMAHRIKMRHSCRIANAVVAISESTKQDLIKYLRVPEEKIHVIYQSCDPIFWRPIEEDDLKEVRKKYNLPEKYIVCVGSIEHRKNQVSVVKAMAELPEDVHLVILGRPHGKYIRKVKSAIRSKKLGNRVHIVSNAEFAHFPAIYSQAIASVYMSRYEGFGIPILESMCCDTPVVTSNVSSMPEAGGYAALYADPSDVKQIAESLNRIISSPDLRKQLVAEGRKQRENFTQSKIIADLYNLYNTLVPQDED